jgi:hypothetical protein
MGSADRSGAGTEPKIDRLARLLADEHVSRRQVLAAGASAVLGITLFEPADTLAGIAEKAKRCPKGETKCGKKCCAKGHVCCGTTCCPKGDTCVTTRHGKKVTHTCKAPKKSEAKPQCETAADCPASPAGSCQQATCTGGTCGFAADDANVPAAATCMSVACVAGAPQSTPLAAETSCGTHSVCDGNGHCVGCASAADCPAATSGSCQKAVCNSGTCGFTADNTNVPAAATCMSVACVAGAPQSTPLAAETSCGTGTVCDGDGHCVGCASDGDCPAAASGSCQKAVCNSGTCGFTADNTNLPAATACTTGTCTGGTPGQQNASSGSACLGVANGICDGAGTCSCSSGYSNCGTPSSDLQCTAVSCANGSLTKCGAVTSCGAYACNSNADGCNTSCSGPTDCTPGNYCNGSSVCVAKAAQGATCTSAGQCVTNNCVDGYCCNSACNTTCMACSAALKGSGLNGSCGAVAASTVSSDCTDQGTSNCGTNGTCSGSGTCAFYSSTTVCVAGSCSGNTAIPARLCNGSGVCNTSTQTPCGAQTCNGGTCS